MPLPQLPYKRPFFAMTLSPHEIEVRWLWPTAACTAPSGSLCSSCVWWAGWALCETPMAFDKAPQPRSGWPLWLTPRCSTFLLLLCCLCCVPLLSPAFLLLLCLCCCVPVHCPCRRTWRSSSPTQSAGGGPHQPPGTGAEVMGRSEQQDSCCTATTIGMAARCGTICRQCAARHGPWL